MLRPVGLALRRRLSPFSRGRIVLSPSQRGTAGREGGGRGSLTRHLWLFKDEGKRPMKFLPLIFRNALRNRRRTILTVLSISMSLFLISALWTLLQQLESPPLTPDSATRIITRHQTSLANTMPISYREKIRAIPRAENVKASH